MQLHVLHVARLVLLAETTSAGSAPSGLTAARNAVGLAAGTGVYSLGPKLPRFQESAAFWHGSQSPFPLLPTVPSATGRRSINLDTSAGATLLPSWNSPGRLRPQKTFLCPQLRPFCSFRADPAHQANSLAAATTASWLSPPGSAAPVLPPRASTMPSPAALPSTLADAGAESRPPAPLALRLLLPQRRQWAGQQRRFLSSGSKEGEGRPTAADSKPAAAADAVYNLPNAVSATRLLSGPVIGLWLLQGHYEAATIALVISGASDWLDGFLARRQGASSVFGSYLDPLADKVLIGCVAGALLANGSMPPWLAAVVVGRDALLVSGAFAFRLRGFGWRWPGREAFFRTADTDSSAALNGPTAGGRQEGEGGGGGLEEGVSAGVGKEGGVAFMRPLLVSKANTVLQLVLLGGYLTRGMYGWPDGEVVAALEVATAATTVVSLAAYGTLALQGKLFR